MDDTARLDKHERYLIEIFERLKKLEEKDASLHPTQAD